jgi:hypothetical protein
MPEQISISEITGKTLLDIIVSNDGDQLLLVFADQTYAAAKLSIYSEASISVIEDPMVSLDHIIDNYHPEVVIYLGLATRDQILDHIIDNYHASERKAARQLHKGH